MLVVILVAGGPGLLSSTVAFAGVHDLCIPAKGGTDNVSSSLTMPGAGSGRFIFLLGGGIQESHATVVRKLPWDSCDAWRSGTPTVCQPEVACHDINFMCLVREPVSTGGVVAASARRGCCMGIFYTDNDGVGAAPCAFRRNTTTGV